MSILLSYRICLILLLFNFITNNVSYADEGLVSSRAIENRSGMVTFGITPYQDMDFLSNAPLYSLRGSDTFYFNYWNGYKIFQNDIYYQYLLNFIPVNPASYVVYDQNEKLDFPCKSQVNTDSDLSQFCTESSLIWKDAIEHSFDRKNLNFNYYGFPDSPNIPAEETLKNHIKQHISYTNIRIKAINTALNNWDQWYSWCAFPPSTSLTGLAVVLNNENIPRQMTAKATIQPLNTEFQTINKSPSNVEQLLKNQFNCVTNSINFITSNLFINSLNQSGTDYNLNYLPTDINKNLPAFININPLRMNWETEAQILASRNWFDAVQIFNFYKSRCNMEKSILHDIALCVQSLNDRYFNLRATTNENWLKPENFASNPIVQCQRKYMPNVKTFFFKGFDNNNSSVYDYTLIQELRNTSYNQQGERSLYINFCFNPKQTVLMNDDSDFFWNNGSKQMLYSSNRSILPKGWDSDFFKFIFNWSKE